MLRAGRSGVQIPEWARYFLFPKKVQNGSRAHPASYSMGTGVLSRVKSGWGMKLNHIPP